LEALSSAWGHSCPDRFVLGVVPPEVPPYAPQQILEHLEECVERGEKGGEWGVGSGEQGAGVALVWIGFSAGVVGGLLAARQWHREGLDQRLEIGGSVKTFSVKAFIAIDGWGVPLWADFPVYSLSPDRFAYEMTRGLRSPLPHFYAEPGVSHLALWESPQRAMGWEESPAGTRLRLNAVQYIERCIYQGV